jgi:RNA polymerase primary sigma factor
VTKETQTLPQESSNDLKIDLDLEADKLIAEANKVPEADIDLDDDDNASMLSSAQEAAAKALASIKIGPKGVYTEDSIRVYLQEIGRIDFSDQTKKLN